MLQILADFLAEPIIALFYKSLQSGEIPQGWYKAILCPIFIKGDPEDAANYHLVIETSVLWKIFENCSKAFLLFLAETRSVSPSQHGFLSRRSCLPNLLIEV